MPVFYVSFGAPISFLLSRAISQCVFVDGFEVLSHLVGHFQLSLSPQPERRQMFADVFLPVHRKPSEDRGQKSEVRETEQRGRGAEGKRSRGESNGSDHSFSFHLFSFSPPLPSSSAPPLLFSFLITPRPD
jgi:hypothetical protein